MDSDAQDLYCNTHMTFDPSGAAAPGDAFRECPDGAVERMHDVVVKGFLLRARRTHGGQKSQSCQERQRPSTHLDSTIEQSISGGRLGAHIRNAAPGSAYSNTLGTRRTLVLR